MFGKHLSTIRSDQDSILQSHADFTWEVNTQFQDDDHALFQPFRRYGTFSFEVDGQPAELTIYVNEHRFFMPFVDSLRGTETYPAGR